MSETVESDQTHKPLSKELGARVDELRLQKNVDQLRMRAIPSSQTLPVKRSPRSCEKPVFDS